MFFWGYAFVFLILISISGFLTDYLYVKGISMKIRAIQLILAFVGFAYFFVGPRYLAYPNGVERDILYAIIGLFCGLECIVQGIILLYQHSKDKEVETENL